MAATTSSLDHSCPGITGTPCPLSKEAEGPHKGPNHRCKFYMDGTPFAAGEGQNHNTARGFSRDDTATDVRGGVRGSISPMSGLCKVVHGKHMAGCGSGTAEGATQADFSVSRAAYLEALGAQGHYQHQGGERWPRLFLCATKSCREVCRLPHLGRPSTIEKVTGADFDGHTHID